jgi:uncharacterized membrane protein YccC
LAGILRVFDAVALLVEAAGRPLPARRGFRLSVPDWLPALVNAGRAFVAIAAVEVFWVVSAWPNGAAAIVFVAIVLLLLSPKGDQAYAGAMTFMVGTAVSVLFAATIKFAVLPGLETFPAFCAAIGLVLIPTGFGMTQTVKPALAPVFMPMTAMFIPLLMPTNQMSYDTAQYCNSAVAIFAGCAAALLSLRLLPPVSPAVRTRRLLALSLRDLRRLAVEPLSTPQDWEGRMYSRLSALPDQAEPFQRAQLMAVHSIGAEIIALREMAPSLGIIPGLEAALKTFAHGNGALAITRLGELDRGLDSHPQTPPSAIALRARARLLAISDLLAEHSSYFDAGASA